MVRVHCSVLFSKTNAREILLAQILAFERVVKAWHRILSAPKPPTAKGNDIQPQFLYNAREPRYALRYQQCLIFKTYSG